MTTIPEIADRINELFRMYGLTHDVVWAKPVVNPPSDYPLQLDYRENEPDPMNWRKVPLHFEDHELVFLGGVVLGDMINLKLTFEELFRGYFDTNPPSLQTRLF